MGLSVAMDPAVVDEIQRVLDEAVQHERITVPWAIESGSRAWGFPSPDSDYDCRFVYIRRREDYLSLFPPRDVLELRQDAVFDVGGWDLRKTLQLILKGNAVAIEWLQSPIRYRGDPRFRDAMLSFADAVVDRSAVARHYYHLGLSMRWRVGDDWRDVHLKKVFYVVRPAFALRWLRQRPARSVAPMNFKTLCDEVELEAEVRKEIARLIDAKARTRELGRGPAPPALLALVLQELDHPDAAWRQARSGAPGHARADALFLELLAAFGPG